MHLNPPNACLGVVARPTFDGFIIEHTSWSVEFWWTVGLQTVVLLLHFVLLEDTTYDRSAGKVGSRISTQASWLYKRFCTFCTCRTVPRQPSRSEFVSILPLPNIVLQIVDNLLIQFSLYKIPILIFFSPVTILSGIFEMINFGWAVMVNTLLAIFLQELPPQGYGFSPQQAAGCML